mmetsp:Transcript_167626/g.538376  ORF Transcript_167626/g.538376 Transcript_167626/m.538376 type:complete len:266 (+) Transcript_167626:85-882(+)|eukprot:CAMPEP_0203854340 /NCGR_PEP_ID=MMETSP0359-20131031/9044_1 /ASSEMBLY_ACC=CAM_ASM_000338 /TAXON_ID=268821 /ORGANISM="Scrippsiella Hangoei, Strain SHTV-5" /LENGTH=265 /DNA_ID=CAMNT_0050770809 /DNA_START=39 /DNA_END=836 /DNA_ORIENTATION=-
MADVARLQEEVARLSDLFFSPPDADKEPGRIVAILRKQVIDHLTELRLVKSELIEQRQECYRLRQENLRLQENAPMLKELQDELDEANDSIAQAIVAMDISSAECRAKLAGVQVLRDTTLDMLDDYNKSVEELHDRSPCATKWSDALSSPPSDASSPDGSAVMAAAASTEEEEEEEQVEQVHVEAVAGVPNKDANVDEACAKETGATADQAAAKARKVEAAAAEVAAETSKAAGSEEAVAKAPKREAAAEAEEAWRPAFLLQAEC